MTLHPEWPRIVIAVAAAFVVAYMIAALVARSARLLMVTVLGADDAPEAHRRLVGRPILILRVLVLLVTTALLAFPLIEMAGLPLNMGLGEATLNEWVFGSGLRIVLIIVIAWLVMRLAATSTRRLERELSEGTGLDVIERTRRAHTLGSLIQNVLGVIVFTVATLMVLREFGVDIVPMLTGASVLGVALGFGAQYLVRDLIAGFFLILEDQVRVGDVAVINGVGGVVEAIKLRTIVLRDAEGTVHVFPNGAVNTLANRSKDYAYYMVDLPVAFRQDTDEVVNLAREIADGMLAEPAFAEITLAPLEVWGVDSFQNGQVIIKMRIKTAPLKQWEVGREFRRRLLAAMRQRGIAVPPMPSEIWLAAAPAGAGEGAAPPSTPARAGTPS